MVMVLHFGGGIATHASARPLGLSLSPASVDRRGPLLRPLRIPHHRHPHTRKAPRLPPNFYARASCASSPSITASCSCFSSSCRCSRADQSQACNRSAKTRAGSALLQQFRCGFVSDKLFTAASCRGTFLVPCHRRTVLPGLAADRFVVAPRNLDQDLQRDDRRGARPAAGLVARGFERIYFFTPAVSMLNGCALLSLVCAASEPFNPSSRASKTSSLRRCPKRHLLFKA